MENNDAQQRARDYARDVLGIGPQKDVDASKEAAKKERSLRDFHRKLDSEREKHQEDYRKAREAEAREAEAKERARNEAAHERAEARKEAERTKFIANGFSPDDFEKIYATYILPRLVEAVESERRRNTVNIRNYI